MEYFDDNNEVPEESRLELKYEDHERLMANINMRELPFNPIDVVIESVVTLILAFSIFYFILEVNEVINYSNEKYYNTINNIIEIAYLLIALAAIILHLIRFRWNRNCFFKIEFDNYPMLFVMFVCVLIDVCFYFMNFISIATRHHDITRILSTLCELLFIIVLLPFVIICACKQVRSNIPNMAMKTKVSLLLAIGGGIVIVMRKITLKIEKDLYNITEKGKNCNSTNFNFVYCHVHKAEDILELVDIVYILIGCVFLIEPLKNVPKLKSEKYEVDFITLSTRVTLSRLSSVSLVRFRWPTIVLSIVLLGLLMSSSYLITGIMDSNSDSIFKKNSLIVFLGCSILCYIIGTVYGAIYYFTDIQTWPTREKVHLHNDEHFNRFTSSFQIIYASSMFISLFYLTKKKAETAILVFEILNFLFLAIEICVQSKCINSAVRRQVTSPKILHWKSKLFPPILLASMNFGFMIISIVYSQNTIFMLFLQNIHENRFVYIVIKDVALPITILNRLHAMAFFINLSIQQWHE